MQWSIQTYNNNNNNIQHISCILRITPFYSVCKLVNLSISSCSGASSFLSISSNSWMK